MSGDATNKSEERAADQRLEDAPRSAAQEQRREDRRGEDRREAIEGEARLEARFASSFQSLPPTSGGSVPGFKPNKSFDWGPRLPHRTQTGRRWY